MEGLRWVLLVFGALVIAGVLIYSHRERQKKEKPAPEPLKDTGDAEQRRIEPSFSADAQADDSADVLDAVEPDGEPQPGPQKIVTLRIVSGNKQPFAGDELVLSLRGIGMRHGRFGIFHRYDGNDEDRVVFSAASLVEPGSFDLENIKEQKIPGISLFMVLPGPVDGAEAFDSMMAASRTLTQSLHAELLDESGSTLSIQRERYLREEIIQFQTRNLVA